MDVRETQIHQWVEYSRCLLQKCNSEKELADRLKELNSYLSSRTFFAGESCSEADVSVFKSLHTVLMNQSFNDKEIFRNVSRWFDNIQHQISSPDKSQVVFLKSPIYLPAVVLMKPTQSSEARRSLHWKQESYMEGGRHAWNKMELCRDSNKGMWTNQGAVKKSFQTKS